MLPGRPLDRTMPLMRGTLSGAAFQHFRKGLRPKGLPVSLGQRMGDTGLPSRPGKCLLSLLEPGPVPSSFSEGLRLSSEHGGLDGWLGMLRGRRWRRVGESGELFVHVDAYGV